MLDVETTSFILLLHIQTRDTDESTYLLHNPADTCCILQEAQYHNPPASVVLLAAPHSLLSFSPRVGCLGVGSLGLCPERVVWCGR